MGVERLPPPSTPLNPLFKKPGAARIAVRVLVWSCAVGSEAEDWDSPAYVPKR